MSYVAREYVAPLGWCVEFVNDSVGKTIETGLDEATARERAEALNDAPRKTRRERMEARAERRREWAEGREAKAEAAWNASHAISEHIPVGQPILVGHHSERRARRDVGRMRSLADKGVEHSNMAAKHASRAEGIERQLRNSIFSDDHDAIEQLDAKIAKLEAERDRIKAFNAACRKAKKLTDDALKLLDETQRRDYVRLVQIAAFQIRENGSMPAYVTTNLGGNINRLKKRRDEIAAKQSA